MTTITKNEGGGKSLHGDKKKTPQPVKHHCKISVEDIHWIRSQDACVQQLWLDCIAAEQFGSNHHILDTSLDIKGKSFRKAKQAIAAKGLFDFQPIHELMDSGQSRVIGWKVMNRHGYYNKKYWEEEATTEASLRNSAEGLEESDEEASGIVEEGFGKMTPPLQAKTLAVNEFQECQPFPNPSPTSFQLSTKVVESLLEKGLPQDEAPLKGASPAEVTEEAPPGDEELQMHLQLALQGIRPAEEIARLLREHPAYRVHLSHCYRLHQWEVEENTPSSTIPATVSECLEALKAKQKKTYRERITRVAESKITVNCEEQRDATSGGVSGNKHEESPVGNSQKVECYPLSMGNPSAA